MGLTNVRVRPTITSRGTVFEIIACYTLTNNRLIKHLHLVLHCQSNILRCRKGTVLYIYSIGRQFLDRSHKVFTFQNGRIICLVYNTLYNKTHLRLLLLYR